MNNIEIFVLPNDKKIKILNLVLNENILTEFDLSLIQNIKTFNIDKNNRYMGKVVPFKTVPLKFDIFLDETIVKNILKHTGNYEYAKEVILHELYHCQDMSITAKTLNANELFFLTIDTTKKYILNIGLKQWSEYYAYYNSAKIYANDIENLDKYIRTIFLDFKAIDNEIKNNKNFKNF